MKFSFHKRVRTYITRSCTKCIVRRKKNYSWEKSEWKEQYFTQILLDSVRTPLTHGTYIILKLGQVHFSPCSTSYSEGIWDTRIMLICFVLCKDLRTNYRTSVFLRNVVTIFLIYKANVAFSFESLFEFSYIIAMLTF